MRTWLTVILKAILLIFGAFIVFIIVLLTYWRWGYYDQMNAVKSKLNAISGVKVIDIWGNEDVTLEEIAARIQIKNKGELVLNDLSTGNYGYPQRVYITEIGGFSFEHISCNCLSGSKGIGSAIDIGTESDFGKVLKISFKNSEMVIDNFDRIYGVLDSLYNESSLVHFVPDSAKIGLLTNETFIRLIKRRSKDQPALYNLIGIEDRFKEAGKLPWKTDSCAKSREY